MPRTFLSQEGRELFEQACAAARMLDHDAILSDLERARDKSAAP
jgi:hypothetical protein